VVAEVAGVVAEVAGVAGVGLVVAVVVAGASPGRAQPAPEAFHPELRWAPDPAEGRAFHPEPRWAQDPAEGRASPKGQARARQVRP
jgi:hypothetical protein